MTSASINQHRTKTGNIVWTQDIVIFLQENQSHQRICYFLSLASLSLDLPHSLLNLACATMALQKTSEVARPI